METKRITHRRAWVCLHESTITIRTTAITVRCMDCPAVGTFTLGCVKPDGAVPALQPTTYREDVH